MKDTDFEDGILAEKYTQDVIKGANNFLDRPWGDVTERREAEQMLKILKSHEKLRAKIDEHSISDQDGEVVLVSFNYKKGLLKIRKDLILRYFTELVNLVKAILRRKV